MLQQGMLATIAIAALTAAVADDASLNTAEERFRILYALGDKKGAYLALLEPLGPHEAIRFYNDITRWVTEANGLEDLVHRLRERDPVQGAIHHREDTRGWSLEFANLYFVGDAGPPRDISKERICRVPVFAPASAFTPRFLPRRRYRTDWASDGYHEETVLSWDKDRVLISSDAGPLILPMKPKSFVGPLLEGKVVVRMPS